MVGQKDINHYQHKNNHCCVSSFSRWTTAVAGLARLVEQAHIYMEVYSSTQRSRVRVLSCDNFLHVFPLSHLPVLSIKGQAQKKNLKKKRWTTANSQVSRKLAKANAGYCTLSSIADISSWLQQDKQLVALILQSAAIKLQQKRNVPVSSSLHTDLMFVVNCCFCLFSVQHDVFA